MKGSIHTRALAGSIVLVSCGGVGHERHSCGLAEGWKEYERYALESSSPLPMRVAGIEQAVEVSAEEVACARLQSGEVSCWDDPRAARRLALEQPALALGGGTHATCVAHAQGVSCLRHDAFLDEDPAIAFSPDIDSSGGVCVREGERGVGDALGYVTREIWACARGADGAQTCWNVRREGARVGGEVSLVDVHAHEASKQLLKQPCPEPPPVDREIGEEARALIEKAKAAMEADDGTEALRSLAAAYELEPRPEILLLKGRLAEMAGRPRAALWNLERYLRCARDDERDPRRGMAKSSIADLRAKLAARPAYPSTDSECPWQPEDDEMCFAPAPEAPDTTELLKRGVVSVSIGPTHACGVERGGKIWCVGSNAMGELGDGSREPREHPVRVQRIEDAVQISAGPQRTCAVLRSGHVECWGQGALTGQRPARGAIRL